MTGVEVRKGDYHAGPMQSCLPSRWSVQLKRPHLRCEEIIKSKEVKNFYALPKESLVTSVKVFGNNNHGISLTFNINHMTGVEVRKGDYHAGPMQSCLPSRWSVQLKRPHLRCEEIIKSKEVKNFYALPKESLVTSVKVFGNNNHGISLTFNINHVLILFMFTGNSEYQNQSFEDRNKENLNKTILYLYLLY
ncbi:hypothetical protein Glove_707g37 [Diversispora epigaea]|uniref:Uncharacterized protein n=1 Tax=Diversispora epigaea TaxID=1348612 RepID=A0A397G6E5_9GLOM|nr:hypothetical protein Glove_707g37 [Diversispora epigaea]